jgi:hypothetical protein
VSIVPDFCSWAVADEQVFWGRTLAGVRPNAALESISAVLTKWIDP